MLSEVEELGISIEDLSLLFQLLHKQPLGRYSIANYLKISISKIRKLLELLNKLGYIQSGGQNSGRRGSYLTKKGIHFTEQIEKHCFIDWDNNKISAFSKILPIAAFYQMSFVKTDNPPINGLVERDIAVRNGASGALSLLIDGGRFKFADSHETIENINYLNLEKLNKFNVMIITFGPDEKSVFTSLSSIIAYLLQDELTTIFS